ncbi:MAG TPA: CoA transferase [Acidimicrobiales bacterium]|nr:CoA transferase [Acidimicrobiales bacterium]
MVDADSRPLAGIRVLAHVVGIAGPIASRVFAWFGAEVIRVESRVNPDLIRRVGSRWLGPDTHGPAVWTDSSPLLNELWGGVRSVGLNLKDAEAFAVAERLVATCDVFLSNFSAPALRDSGLGYEALAALRPDLVYVVLPGFGATEGTPYHDYLAWGPNQAPLVGLDELTGWPDRPPAAIASIALPDYTNGLTGVVGALAALEHRDRTGEGQRVEVAQFEATVALLGDILVDHDRTGHVPGRAGNRGGWAAPEGVYPCRGRDRWVAITVEDDAGWAALCRVAVRPEWLADERFATAEGRLAHLDELDALIAGWTAAHTDAEIAEWLQAAAVAAAAVVDNAALLADRHLASRGFWGAPPNTRFGPDLTTSIPINLAATPGGIERGAPSFGEDNEEVLVGLAGCTPEQVAAMAERGAVWPMGDPAVRLRRPYLDWVPQLLPELDWGPRS